MTTDKRSRDPGYESPTGVNGTRALASDHIRERLVSELEQDGSRESFPSRQPPANMGEVANKTERAGAVSIKDRIACFQWTWFTSTMATGGVANVLASSMVS